MDVAILPAVAALAGSLVGGLSILTASLITQRRQFRGQALIQESMKRETLYAEFIKEASRRRAEAWSHQAESPEVIAGLYSGVERMRLFSSHSMRCLELIGDSMYQGKKTLKAKKEKHDYCYRCSYH